MTSGLWAIVTSQPGYYIVGDLPLGFGYQHGAITITLVDPLVIKVKGKKLAVEEYEALEGNVTFVLSSYAAVGPLKKSLYAPIVQYRELKASGKSFEDMAKELVNVELAQSGHGSELSEDKAVEAVIGE